MIINYEKFPLIRYFEKGFKITDSKGFKTFKDDWRYQKDILDKELGNLYSHWDYIKSKCMDNIQIFSDSFRKAAFGSAKCFNKIGEEVPEILKSKKESGVFVYNSNGCYMIYLYFPNDNIQIWFFENECLTFVGVYDLNIDEFSCEYSSINLKETTKDEYTAYVYNVFILPMLFKIFAKVEIEEGKSGKTIKSSILGDKLKNKISLDVKVLDSTWFTTICRNEGFKVRGHFRLQPKKNEKGEWTKELIYINEFEKHGYHRQAKIETIKSN